MRNLTILLALFVLSPAAFAGNSHECQGNSCNGGGTNSAQATGIGVSSSDARSTAISGSSSKAISGSQSGAIAIGGASLSGASASGGNASGGVSNVSVSNGPVSVTTNEARIPDSVKTVPAAPDVLAMPTAPCRVSVGVSGSWLGGSVGVGSSVLDEGCDLRERVRLLHNLGLPASAIQLFCNADPQVAAVVPVCEAMKPAPAAQAPAAPQADGHVSLVGR